MPVLLARLLFITLFSVCCITFTFGQVDSINYRIEAAGAFATEGYLPLWIFSNRNGILEEDKSNGYLRAGIFLPYNADKKFSVAAGLDGLLSTDIKNSRIQQGYLKLKYGVLELKGGLEQETIGVCDPTLSTGSLYLSQNARPIPKVTFSIPNFVDVPLTNGYVQFKASFAHGWMGNDRWVKGTWLHETTAYLQIGKNWKVTPYGGLTHGVFWGGTDPDQGKIPSDFKNFFKVMTARGGDNTGFGGEDLNVVGDHRGIIDVGLRAKLKEADLLFYNQLPYEDASGTIPILNNHDFLSGISLKSKNKNKIISGVTYELLYTKYQSGPGTPDGIPGQSNYGYKHGGRDNYYNNYLYNTGWTHHNLILGTPLFLTDTRADLYFGDYHEPTNLGFDFYIVNNRVVGHHIGLEGLLAKRINYRAFFTFTRNFGTYGGLNGGIQSWGSRDPNYNVDYKFETPLNQFYGMIEASTGIAFENQLEAMATIGLDAGDMTDNLGLMLGLRWKGLLRKSAD